MQLLKQGYSVISVDNVSESLYRSSLDACQRYFSQTSDIKNKDITDTMEHGYYRLDYKEFFAIRNRSVPDILKPCLAYIEHLHHLAKSCLKNIAHELQLPEEKLYQLIETNPLPENGKSSSLLRIIHYDKQSMNPEEMACMIHEDLGLLTITHRTNNPSLETYDFSNNGTWENMELCLEENKLLIMVGSTLAHISNLHYLPCIHRVRKNSQARLSLVYQVRAMPDLILDSTQFETIVTGDFRKSFKMTTAEFYHQKIKQGKSVNNSF